jgi:hypothetical protein
MQHSYFARITSGLKGKAFAAIIIGLCIIVSFCPQIIEPAPRNSSTSPEFSSSNNIAFLPALIQMEGELCPLECNGNVASNKRTSATSRETSLMMYGLVSPTSCDNCIFLVYFSGIRGADFKMACQLLNLPPPSTLL